MDFLLPINYDDINGEFLYTDKLKTLLQDKTTEREFEFINRNLYECLLEIFLELGGVPRVIANSQGDSVLDIELFDEEVGDYDMSEYLRYREEKNINYYSNTAEVNLNNIVNEEAVNIFEKEGEL